MSTKEPKQDSPEDRVVKIRAQIDDLESKHRKIDAEIVVLRDQKRTLARQIEDLEQQALAARTPIPGPRIG